MSTPRAATVGSGTTPTHPHVQRLIAAAPRLEGQRREELTALLLRARTSAPAIEKSA